MSLTEWLNLVSIIAICAGAVLAIGAVVITFFIIKYVNKKIKEEEEDK